jgi:hypothetical protein
MADQKNWQWEDEDAYWRSNFRSRPYGSAERTYEFYQPGYRYGYDAANRFEGRSWADVESDLASKWNSYEDRGESTWDQIKDAVRDAWDRVTGKHPVGSR